MKYNYECSDGGKKDEGFENEKNDCTVRAFALAFDTSYNNAHEILRKCGRKDQRGFHSTKFLDSYRPNKYFKKSVQKIPCNLTLSKTLENIANGIFLWTMHGHILCIKDKKVLDKFQPQPGSRCRGLWKVGELRKRKKEFTN